MDSAESKEKSAEKKSGERVPYVAPAIVYEGTISTRAGSPLGSSEGDGIDPADLFGGG